MSYQPPIEDMLFTIRELATLDEEAGTLDHETLATILTEAARWTVGELVPLQRVGDEQPGVCHDGSVQTAPGFREAFRSFVAAGWQGLQHPEALGGQGLSKRVAAACTEMFNSANLAWALCPLLTDSAIEALLTAGSPDQQACFVPPLIRGDWTGTMNLTESEAGSDLARVCTWAEPQPDGRYRLAGQKIYITYGDHDFADNIVHMVLARTPHAPPGVKGLSLFIVPKWLMDEQGQARIRNDVHCAALEHKLGIRASPTAVMVYGAGVHPVAEAGGERRAGAVAWLMGLEGRGLEYMFIMMNAARFAVGLQGIGVAEHAYQKARDYARIRVQGRDVAALAGPAVPIVRHPDVRRMLMTMRALTQGARQLAYVAAGAYDASRLAQGAAECSEHAKWYDFLVPIIKGFATEMSLEVTSLGIQVHGGIGFIEEAGSAQLYRDARILTLYEGTTAIQANDLLGRKTLRDQGAMARKVVQRMLADVAAWPHDDPIVAALAAAVQSSGAELIQVIDYLLAQAVTDLRSAYAGSVPYLLMFGTVLTGWQWGRAAGRAASCLQNNRGDPGWLRSKRVTAQFYAAHILPRASLYRQQIMAGAESVLSLDEAWV